MCCIRNISQYLFHNNDISVSRNIDPVQIARHFKIHRLLSINVDRHLNKMQCNTRVLQRIIQPYFFIACLKFVK
jgi:hypothetical protein